MTTQLLAWAATITGLASTWLLGRHHPTGWLLGVACCALWITVNARLDVWAGITSAAIGAALSLRAWHHWRQAER